MTRPAASAAVSLAAMVVLAAAVPVDAAPVVAAPVESPGTVSGAPLRGVDGVEPWRFPVDVRPDRGSGPTAGAEVSITNADQWHAAGLTGAGVRVGIIDFFDVAMYWNVAEMGPHPVPGITARCFDLGADCTAEFFDGVDDGGDDHGPAVAEVIKDMAPGAELLIGRATTATDYAALIEWFADNGVRVVSRSLGSRYDGPGDGRGALDEVADLAVQRGLTWVNSAGNNGSGRYYRHPVRLAGDDVMFGSHGTSTWLRYNGCAVPGGIRWSNDWDLPPAARTDYDVFIYEAPLGDPDAGTLVASATADQRDGAPPLESFVGSACPTFGRALYLRIERVRGTPTGDVLEILDYGEGFAGHTQTAYSASTPIVDSRNPGVLSVGAIDPPASGTVAFYGSQGPTADGRIAPSLTAPSGFTNHTFGGPFSGTSAAAPVVSGAAALLLGAGLAAGPRELGNVVRNTVVDRGPSGPDNAYGTGELRLPPPPKAPGPAAPAAYVPLAAPTRILDTRPASAVGPPHLLGEMWAGEILDVAVAAQIGVASSAITAVAANITLVDAGAPGYGQALPTYGAAVGGYSNANVDAAGQTRPNFAIVPVGVDGSISIYSDAGGHLLVDVLGYFAPAPGAARAGRFVGLADPARVLDTRTTDGQVASGDTVSFAVPPSLPAAEVAALVVTVTAAATEGRGFVQAFPGGRTGEIYRTSTLNVVDGGTAANTVIVPVTEHGASLFADLGPGGSTHLIADVTGYITSDAAVEATEGLFVPLRPARAYDSRAMGDPLADDTLVTVSANSAAGVTVPLGASGVVWNFTATATERYGFVSGWPADRPRPATSSLNWSAAAMTVANAGVIRPNVTGAVQLLVTDDDPTTNGAMAHLLVDVFGYFT